MTPERQGSQPLKPSRWCFTGIDQRWGVPPEVNFTINNSPSSHQVGTEGPRHGVIGCGLEKWAPSVWAHGPTKFYGLALVWQLMSGHVSINESDACAAVISER